MARVCEFLIGFICSAFFIVFVCGDCVLKFSVNPPIIVKSFGSKKITRKLIGGIKLKEGEKIEAYCATGFQTHDSRGYFHAVQYHCNSDSRMVYKRDKETTVHQYNGNYDENYDQNFGGNTEYYDNIMGCREGPSQVLYESQRPLQNCAKNMSYAIGISPSPSNKFVTAGICYDLDLLTLKHVNYIAHPRKSEIISNQPFLQTISLDKELTNTDDLFSFISEQSFSVLLQDINLQQPLLKSFDFDYTNLVQEAALKTELDGFNYIFNTIWWRSLRLGNWKLYLEALEKRIKTINYMVFMGTSGVMSLPKTDCYSPEILSVEANGITVNAPEYIWAHLKSLNGNSSEDFVVIGNNSPFNPISNSNSFCEDICDQIDWLKTSVFGKVRLLPTLGVVFCCRPEDVAHKLDNFPYKHSSTTFKPNVETTTASTANLLDFV